MSVVPVGSVVFLSFSYYEGPPATQYGVRIAIDPATSALITRCPLSATIDSESQVLGVLTLDGGAFLFGIANYVQTYSSAGVSTSIRNYSTSPFLPAGAGQNGAGLLGSNHSTEFYLFQYYVDPGTAPYTLYLQGVALGSTGSVVYVRGVDDVLSDGSGNIYELNALCANASALMYYIKGDDYDPALATHTLKTFDLAANTAGSDITTYAPGIVYPLRAMTLRGGDLIVEFSDASLELIDGATGASIFAYTTGMRVEAAGLDDTSFWVLNGGVYEEIDTATGAVLNTLNVSALGFASDQTKPMYILQATFTSCVNPPPIAPPLAPPTPCVPTVPGSGGTGNSGCNTGGSGTVLTYTGPYGTVPNHADPAAKEPLMGKEGRGVEPWIEIHHVDYPTDVVTVSRRAFVELGDDPAMEGGRKVDGLVALGATQNSMGNEQGRAEAASVDVRSSDAKDSFFRTAMATQQFDGDEMLVKLASDAGRVVGSGTIPRVAMRGIIQQTANESIRQTGLSVVDRRFADNGPLGQDAMFPFWTFKDLQSAAPFLPADIADVGIPVLAGPKSDEGGTNPLTGAPAEKGTCSGYFIGKFDIPGASSPIALPGTPLSVVVANLNAAIAGGATASDLNVNFGIGLIDAANLIDYYNTHGNSVPTTYLDLARIIGFADLDALLGAGTTPPSGPDVWGVIVFGLGPWKFFWDIFASDLGVGSATATHDRTKLDLTTRIGQDILVPGLDKTLTPYAGWPFADPWFTLVNDDGVEFHLAAILVRYGILDDHVNGVVNITANAWGAEEIGDGSGDPLFHAHLIKHWWYENHVESRYSSGLYADATTYPIWANGDAKVKSSQFFAMHALTVSVLGGEGLTGGLYFGERKSVTDWASDIDRWIGSLTPITQDGQYSDFMFNPAVVTTAWPIMNHVTDIFGPIRQASGIERENVTAGPSDWDPDKKVWRNPSITRTSTLGIQKNKYRRRQGDPIDNGFLYDPAFQTTILDFRLALLEFGMQMIEVDAKQGWLDYDVGSGLFLNSEEGYGAGGYVLHRFIIWRRRFDFRTRLVTLTLWDVEALLP